VLHSEYLEEEAAKIAVAVMREYEKKFVENIACCFNDSDEALYDRLTLRGEFVPLNLIKNAH